LLAQVNSSDTQNSSFFLPPSFSWKRRIHWYVDILISSLLILFIFSINNFFFFINVKWFTAKKFWHFFWLHGYHCCCISNFSLLYAVAGSEDSNVYFYDLTKPKHTCVNKLQVGFTSIEDTDVKMIHKLTRYFVMRCRVIGFLWWGLLGTMEKTFWLHLIFTA
jgi:hypothetical protein